MHLFDGRNLSKNFEEQKGRNVSAILIGKEGSLNITKWEYQALDQVTV